MNKRSVSSRDVAREAGVSQATVSYVLNNVQGIKIKQETKDAVLLAAKKLNYHPDLIARSMRLKKSMSIGIVTDKSASSLFFMSALEGIKNALLPFNYSLTLCFNKTHDLEEAEYIKYYNSNRIDGFIFAYAQVSENEINYMQENSIPFVIIDTNVSSEIVHIVRTDMKNAINEAILELKTNGIDEIGYIGNGALDKNSRKYNEYINGLNKNTISINNDLIYKMPNSDNDNFKNIESFFMNNKKIPRAVFCDRQNIAYDLLKYAMIHNIKIPYDMSVILIATSQFAQFTYPSLSTIEAPVYDMGYLGGEMLLNIMNDNTYDDVVILEWIFNKRESI